MFVSSLPSALTYKTRLQFWNFLPKNLVEQFRRVANIYFLVIAVVTLTPVSPVRPGAFLVALTIVLGATAIKEAIEDWVCVHYTSHAHFTFSVNYEIYFSGVLFVV